jgi:hypothetical protein
MRSNTGLRKLFQAKLNREAIRITIGAPST